MVGSPEAGMRAIIRHLRRRDVVVDTEGREDWPADGLLPQLLRSNEHDGQIRHTLEMPVAGNKGEVAFQRGSGDQGVHVTDQISSGAKCAANIGVSLKRLIAEQQRRDFDKEFAKFRLALRKVRITVQVFDDFAIAQNARSDLSSLKPWANTRHCTPATEQIRGERRGIEEVAAHTVNGAEGGFSWRIRSNASIASSKSRSLHAPAKSSARWRVSSV